LVASKTKNGRIAIDEPPEGTVNGPLGHSWDHTLC